MKQNEPAEVKKFDTLIMVISGHCDPTHLETTYNNFVKENPEVKLIKRIETAQLHTTQEPIMNAKQVIVMQEKASYIIVFAWYFESPADSLPINGITKSLMITK